MAEALRDWLPDVIQQVRPWMSATDIDAGVRWTSKIGKELESSDFGVICLTPDNTSAPWILFESGALSKKLDDSRVVPFLLKLTPSDIQGPLAQFNAVESHKEGTRKLVSSIFFAFERQPVSVERLDRAFEQWWPTLETRLGEIPDVKKKKEVKRSDSEILGEILGTVRSLQRTVIDLERESEKTKKAIGSRRVYSGWSVPQSATPRRASIESDETVWPAAEVDRYVREQQRAVSKLERLLRVESEEVNASDSKE